MLKSNNVQKLNSEQNVQKNEPITAVTEPPYLKNFLILFKQNRFAFFEAEDNQIAIYHGCSTGTKVLLTSMLGAENIAEHQNFILYCDKKRFHKFLTDQSLVLPTLAPLNETTRNKLYGIDRQFLKKLPMLFDSKKHIYFVNCKNENERSLTLFILKKFEKNHLAEINNTEKSIIRQTYEDYVIEFNNEIAVLFNKFKITAKQCEFPKRENTLSDTIPSNNQSGNLKRKENPNHESVPKKKPKIDNNQALSVDNKDDSSCEIIIEEKKVQSEEYLTLPETEIDIAVNKSKFANCKETIKTYHNKKIYQFPNEFICKIKIDNFVKPDTSVPIMVIINNSIKENIPIGGRFINSPNKLTIIMYPEMLLVYNENYKTHEKLLEFFNNHLKKEGLSTYSQVNKIETQSDHYLTIQRIFLEKIVLAKSNFLFKDMDKKSVFSIPAEISDEFNHKKAIHLIKDNLITLVYISQPDKNLRIKNYFSSFSIYVSNAPLSILRKRELIIITSPVCKTKEHLLHLFNRYLNNARIAECKISEVTENNKAEFEHIIKSNRNLKILERIKNKIKLKNLFKYTSNKKNYILLEGIDKELSTLINDSTGISNKLISNSGRFGAIFDIESFGELCSKVYSPLSYDYNELPKFNEKKHEKNKHTKIKKSGLKKTFTVTNFFETEDFFRLGNNGDLIFYECKNENDSIPLCRKLKNFSDFQDISSIFHQMQTANKSFLYFNYSDKFKNFIDKKLIKPKITSYHALGINKTIINELITQSKRFSHTSNAIRKTIFENLIISTLAEKSVWIKDEKKDDTCIILLTKEMLSYNSLFSYYCSNILNTMSKEQSFNFCIIQKSREMIVVKNYPHLLLLLKKLLGTAPHFSENILYNNQKKKMVHMSQPLSNTPIVKITENNTSPFQHISIEKYNDIIDRIKNSLPAHLKNYFVLTPKTIFPLITEDDITILNATISALQNKPFKYILENNWEKDFYIGFVDKLAPFGFELGVFATKNIVFSANKKLCHYPGRFSTDKPEDMTYAYELEDGYIYPQNNEYGLIALMNTAASEYGSHISVVLNEKNPHLLDVRVSSYGKEQVNLKKGDQFLNYFGSDYRLTLANKNIQLIPLNTFDGNLTLDEEFNKEILVKNYLNENNLTGKQKNRLEHALNSSQFFSRKKWKNKQLLLPEISVKILDGKFYSKWQKAPFSEQIEYPLLFKKNNKLCPRRKQPEITPLMLAACLGNTNAIEYLLKFGADINRADTKLNTASFYSLKSNLNVDRMNTLRALIKSEKVDVTAQNSEGNTILHETILLKKPAEWLTTILNANKFELPLDELENNKLQTIFDVAISIENEEAIDVLSQFYTNC